MDNEKSKSGTNFLGFLGLLFIALKLTGQINWSWLWVLSPLWIPFVIVIIIAVIVSVVEYYNRRS